MKTIKVILFSLCLFFANLPLHAKEKMAFSAIKGAINTYISQEVMGEAYRRMGIEMVVMQYPARRALAYSNEGKVDGELHRIPDIEKEYPNLHLIPVAINKVEGMVYSKGVRFSVKGWQSLKPYKIGIRRGIQFSEKGTSGMDVYVANTFEELFEILDKGIVDIIVVPHVTGMDLAKKLRISGIKPLEQPIESYPLYHYLHQKNQHLIPKLTSVLQTMEKEGFIEETREQFLLELSR